MTLIGNFASKGLSVLVLASNLALAQPAAAQNSELTPEQAQTVKVFKEEWLKSGVNMAHRGEYSQNISREEILDDITDDINPILVGKNVVFNPNWLAFIGKGKPLTEETFSRWRDNADKAYDAFADLTGSVPKLQKIYVNVLANKNFPQSAKSKGMPGMSSGHQHGSGICFNKDSYVFPRRLREVGVYDSWNETLLHEMAHCFAISQKWEAESEAAVQLLIAYVLENADGAKIGATAAGEKFRKDKFKIAQGKYARRTMEDFDYTGGTAYEYYLLGLVDKVGWDAYKMAFRSYKDNSYPPKEQYSVFPEVKARDFFDRLAYFSGKPDAVRMLPDKGKIHEKFFVEGKVKPKPVRVPAVKLTVKSVNSVVPKFPTAPTALPGLQNRPLHNYVKPEIKELNSNR